MDTIVALATARGKAGVSVVRLSGPLAFEVCRRLCGDVPEPRRASLRKLRNEHGEVIDSGLVLTFSEGKSFTGEESCEFHVHGSTSVVAEVLRCARLVDGVRAAEPGEFTRRAFLSGRLDLVDVESLADLIDAETEAQRRHAVALLEGSGRQFIENLRESLVTALSMIEASLDFADEELPSDMIALIDRPLHQAADSLARQIEGRRSAERLRDGFEVAILGKVNAGKSSLLNALAGRDAAITSSQAGTTRDVIEVRLDIAGLPVTLLDTAGLRETDDEVELIGIQRGQRRAAAADLRIFLKSVPDEIPGGVGPDDIVVLSKSDLWHAPGVSAKTGAGIDALILEIEEKLRDRAARPAVFSRERHFDQLERAAEHVSLARSTLVHVANWDRTSEHIRLAARALDGILGRVDVEELLGRIFASFCIGK